MKILLRAFLFFLLLQPVFPLYGQQGIPATGGSATGSGGTVTYSIGLVDYINSSGTGTVSQGVQQPYEVFTLGVPEPTGLNVTVFPNPASHFILLEFPGEDLSGLVYSLYDIQGALLEDGDVCAPEITLVFSSYSPGTYLLKIVRYNQEIQSFKIIKNQ